MFNQRKLINYWISIEEVELRKTGEKNEDEKRTKGENTTIVGMVSNKFINFCRLLPELSLPIETQVFV